MSDTRGPFHGAPHDRDDPPTVQTGGQVQHDSLGAYVLGALAIDERRLFELHVFICAACRADLAAYERVVALLPYGLPPQQPPAGARDRLLALARAEASEAPTVSMPVVVGDAPSTPAGDEDAPTVVGAAPTVVSAAPSVLAPAARTDEAPTAVMAAPVQQAAVETPTTAPARRGPARRGARIKLASIGWAAALLLVVAAGLLVGAWSATGPHASIEVETLARLPGGQILKLSGTGVPSASARLYVVEAGRRAELTVDALLPPRSGRVYQLWFAGPNQTIRSGTVFGVNPRGDAAVQVVIPMPLERVRAIFVTQEPAPGLASPTGLHLLDWTP